MSAATAVERSGGVGSRAPRKPRQRNGGRAPRKPRQRSGGPPRRTGGAAAGGRRQPPTRRQPPAKARQRRAPGPGPARPGAEQKRFFVQGALAYSYGAVSPRRAAATANPATTANQGAGAAIEQKFRFCFSADADATPRRAPRPPTPDNRQQARQGRRGGGGDRGGGGPGGSRGGPPRRPSMSFPMTGFPSFYPRPGWGTYPGRGDVHDVCSDAGQNASKSCKSGSADFALFGLIHRL